MSNEVSVDLIDSSTALQHWQAASNASVFSHPVILAALSHEVHWWLASLSGAPVCLWPVCLDEQGRSTRPAFCYYVGPIDLSQRLGSPRKRLMRDVAIQHALLRVLTKHYPLLLWSTLPGHCDLRPWQWFQAGDRTLCIVPRHTAVIDGLDCLKSEEITTIFSKSRQRDLRIARERGAVLIPEIAISTVKDLYLQTLNGNGNADLARRRFASVEALCELVSRGHGFTITCGLVEDGEPHATWLVLLAKGQAHSALVACDSIWRRRCFNAFGRFHEIKQAIEYGAARYDCNGVNSLNNSLNQHSYGAEVAPYFNLSL